MQSTRTSWGANPRIYLIGLILWMVGITLASLLPADEFSSTGWEIPYQDKLAHFIFYFGAMWLAGMAIHKSIGPGPRRKVLMRRALVGLLLFGLAIEGLQMVLPAGRSAEWTDVLANTFGMLAALASLKRGFHEVFL